MHTHTQCYHYSLMRNNFKLEVCLHSFLSSAVDGGELSLHTVIDLHRGKIPPVSVEVSKSVCNAECVGDHFKTDVHELMYKIRFLPHW
jgi:hypothetical protein